MPESNESGYISALEPVRDLRSNEVAMTGRRAYSGLKVPIPSVPDFPGQSRFLTMCSGKKSHFSRDAHLSIFLAWCPTFVLICPFLQPYAYTSMLSVYMKKSLEDGSPPRTPLEDLMTLPEIGPRWLVPAYDYLLRRSSRIVMPNLGTTIQDERQRR